MEVIVWKDFWVTLQFNISNVDTTIPTVKNNILSVFCTWSVNTYLLRFTDSFVFSDNISIQCSRERLCATFAKYG